MTNALIKTIVIPTCSSRNIGMDKPESQQEKRIADPESFRDNDRTEIHVDILMVLLLIAVIIMSYLSLVCHSPT